MNFGKNQIFFFIISTLLLLFFFSCSKKQNTYQGRVHIKENKGKYTLYRNGNPYEIKGAAGDSNFNTLKQSGGNTIRIWDTVGLARVLDSAHVNNIAVIVGLPIYNSDFTSFYNDNQKVQNQYYAFKSLVNRFKNHPSVLMWCLGNELDFPYKLSYNNFYKAFNDLTDMIHADDPDHPVITTLLNFNKKYIFNLKVRCNIDLISFNIFSRIDFLKDDLKELSFFWNGPYMLSEWGIDGPWEGTPQTAWGAFIENNSTKKAEHYLERYQEHMPLEDKRFLGSFVFFWGQKQEGTKSWFSLFDENGANSETVSSMKQIWTGKKDSFSYPQINYMLLNKKGAASNILLSEGELAEAEVLLLDDDKIKSVKWEIFKEDWYKENNLHSTKKLEPLQGLIQNTEGLRLKFIAPEKEGPYRIFATIYNDDGHFAICNIPFYVLAE